MANLKSTYPKRKFTITEEDGTVIFQGDVAELSYTHLEYGHPETFSVSMRGYHRLEKKPIKYEPTPANDGQVFLCQPHQPEKAVAIKDVKMPDLPALREAASMPIFQWEAPTGKEWEDHLVKMREHLMKHINNPFPIKYYDHISGIRSPAPRSEVPHSGRTPKGGCQCEIKDLMSTGHNPTCPERKKS